MTWKDKFTHKEFNLVLPYLSLILPSSGYQQ